MIAILVTLDCVRADHLDGSRGLTPELDRLRAEGTTFTQAFSQSQNTLSSHLTILTSNYLFQHGVYSNHVVKALPAHALPRRLAEHGWSCGAFTSVEFLARALGDAIGPFDARYDHPSLPVWRRGWLRLRRHPDRVPAARTLRDGLRWLVAREKGEPCFLWLHLFDAHMVYEAPRRYLRREGAGARAAVRCREALRAAGLHYAGHAAYERRVPPQHFPARYRAAVRHLDALLGRFVAALRRHDLWDETLFVLTADHGECLLGEHGLYCMHQKLFDETVHVPLWIHFPGGAHAGRSVDALVEHVDIAPTVARLAGFDEPLYMGRDLGAVAAGETAGRAFVFSEHVERLLRAARDREHLCVERTPEIENRRGLPLEEETLFRRDGAPVGADRGAAEARLRGAMDALVASRPDVRAAWRRENEVPTRIGQQLERLGYL